MSKEYQDWVKRGREFYDQGDYKNALSAILEAEKVDPLRQHFSDIQTAMSNGDFANAEYLAADMLAEIPAHPRAIYTLSHLAERKGNFVEQIGLLNAGLSQQPANIFLRHMLIDAYKNNGDFQAELDTARRLVKIHANFLHYWSLSRACLRHGLCGEGLEAADHSLEFLDANASERADIHLLRGHAYKLLGQSGRAIEAYNKSLSIRPDSGDAWWSLADLKTYKFSNDQISEMEKRIFDEANSSAQRAQISFAIARAWEKKDDMAQAIKYYHKANGLRPNVNFNPKSFDKSIDKLIAGTDSDRLAVQADRKHQSPTPIFIVGLPRSGSTLIEQILASHSQIEGTMELLVLPSLLYKTQIKHKKPHLESLNQMSPEDLKGLGQAYLETSKIYRSENKPYFIDKLPHNHEHIWAIHKILPEAVIIDARRNPMDCGFSLYKQHFADGSDFSYSLENIGAYYNGYLKLMDHWDQVLPGKVFHIQYETLIENVEDTVRSLLAHIGLEFEPNCLKFYENKRAVRTSSSEQVRQPINRKGIAVWRQVEDELEPLKKALGPATLARFKKELIL